MSSLFAFRCAAPGYPRPNSTLVIFAGPSGFDANAVLTAISDETRSSLAPELVLVLVPSAIKSPKGVLTDDHGVLAALSPTTAVGLYTYAPAGTTKLSVALRGAPPPKLPLAELRQQGMSVLFARRGGVIEAGPTEHFVKPSKRLDTRFLRASHALSDGAEIFFVAFWLLPYLAKYDVKHAHIDSASIASVVLAASLMRGGEVPVIHTFQSYEGYGRHKFNIDRDELVLISASQSGALAQELAGKVKEASLVITLFSTADSAPDTSLLCDLRYHPSLNVFGLQPSARLADARSTRPIRLIGEHFTAEARPPRSIVPSIKDAPDVVQKCLALLQGQHVFRTYRASLRGEIRAVWIDIEKLLATDVFAGWVKDIVARTIPVATKAVVYFGEDPGSKPLADAILGEATRQGAPLDRAELLPLADLEADGAKAKWPEDRSAVVIVGGVTGHGAELLAASRALREYASQSHRVFLTTAAMPSSKRAALLLRSNLVQPDHRFEPMFELIIDRAKTVASWVSEYNFLSAEVDDLPGVLVERLEELRKASVGLEDNLFLLGANKPLALRQNFAFWPGQNCSGASQADVFTTIAVILENLRTGEKIETERRLSNSIYDRSVLSGETFARYNDGIIQAAILRAAHPVELNYEDALDESRLVTELIIQMAELAGRPQGEALPEFLLALVLRRMKLCEADIDRLKQHLLGANLVPMQRWLVKHLP